MKANLPQNEPLRLKKWAELRIYEKLREICAGRPFYLLHDGPPYANGPIHLGHALNKGLKDFVVKSKTMAGFDSPYVPGYDCHGLPIEIKVDEQLGRKKLEMPVPAVLEACRAYAQKYVDLQTSQFQRIGCFGRWDKPYMTMARDYEARTLKAFYGFLENGFVYRGLKPVYWCIHDRTALAEAEVEYESHTSPSIYVRYQMTSDPGALSPALAGRDVYTIIWTTTPWTIPASMAVAFHPDFEYVALATTLDAPSTTLGAPSKHQAQQETDAWVGKQDFNGPVYIVAAELAPAVIAAGNLGNTIELARFKGSRLEHTTFKHPFLERSILGVLGTYVTADQGTGAVHTAPSHGADDFYTGQRYSLDQTCRVDASGHLHADPQAWLLAAPAPFEGKTVWEANPIIVAMLEERRALLAVSDLEHSYPHCWRCHNPVIFRATEQWFISLETPMKRADGSDTSFRQLTIEEIDKVVWDPTWGKERITNMMATRPDWCISRQRIWGVPIAVFMCEDCSEPIIDPALNRKIVALFEDEGAEAWHTTPVETLLLEPRVCKKCGASRPPGQGFRKETDILDVWFDSGTSWFAVCESDPDLRDIYKAFQSHNHAESSGIQDSSPGTVAENSPTKLEATKHPGTIAENSTTKFETTNHPATVAENSTTNFEATKRQGTTSVVPYNAPEETGALAPAVQPGMKRPTVLYLEGGDQHRGWFHSSLLTSVGLRGRAPYSQCNTCGFTLDEQGRAMSKSLGNGVDPVDIAERMGGEIVRLWVASIDFREDMAASENLMARCAELYRKVRNTFRFLLGNLHGFDPARDRVPESELLPLDRYMLARTRDLTEKIRAWYEAFEFHRVYQAVNEFAIVDLSSFYLDILKDRMYTFAPTSHARRSAQTVLWQITETLVRLVAPIMSFTADEVWEYLPTTPNREPSVHLALFPKPEEIYSQDPTKLIEEWKQLFSIRDEVLQILELNRQAKVIGKGLEADVYLTASGEELALLQRHHAGLKEILNVSRVEVKQGPDMIALRVDVSPAAGHKCARCWNFMPEVSSYGIWQNVCTRCQNALKEMKIEPPEDAR